MQRHSSFTDIADDAWIRLSQGKPERVILAIDVEGSVRQEAGFRDLAKHLRPGMQMWHSVLPEVSGSADYLAPDRYITRWLNGRPFPERRVDAVLGYCAGSVFACAAADGLEAVQSRPAVVLFNPGMPTEVTLRRDFTGMMTAMRELSEAEKSAFLRIDDPALWLDFEQATRHCLSAYDQACGIVVERLGLEPDLKDQLADALASYLSYLSAARKMARKDIWSSAVSIISADHQEPDFTQLKIPVAVGRRNLLDHPSALTTLGGLLDRKWREVPTG